MKVTKVYFHEIQNPSNSLLAFANVEFDGEFTIKGFKVFNGRNGVFAKVPQERNGEKYYDTLRFSDESYYKEGTKTHPILAAVIEKWTERQTSSDSAGSGGSGSEQPW